MGRKSRRIKKPMGDEEPFLKKKILLGSFPHFINPHHYMCVI
jgi:hypothetical protein